jgi:hypothetical protein
MTMCAKHLKKKESSPTNYFLENKSIIIYPYKRLFIDFFNISDIHSKIINAVKPTTK